MKQYHDSDQCMEVLRSDARKDVYFQECLPRHLWAHFRLVPQVDTYLQPIAWIPKMSYKSKSSS